MEENKKLVLIQMDRNTQRSMVWKDCVYETIMGYLVIACDSENMPAMTKRAIMEGIEELHMLDMYDYDKLAISINQTFWNINKTLMRATTMSSAERMSVTEQLKGANQVFIDRVKQSADLNKRIFEAISEEGKSKDGETQTK